MLIWSQTAQWVFISTAAPAPELPGARLLKQGGSSAPDQSQKKLSFPFSFPDFVTDLS